LLLIKSKSNDIIQLDNGLYNIAVCIDDCCYWWKGLLRWQS